METLKDFGIVLEENLFCERADIHAIKAVVRGEADPGQQRRAMDWIITHATGYYELSHRSEPHKTEYNEGRRFVGWLIVKLSNMRLIRRNDEQG